ncbi:MAG: GNAT family N-acetyltransferase [Bacilli bacterium]|nr:GNAT family N-acetyltransferase [Bacilli bacterium]MDD4282734.1 GNAT family N-acetyltransferase [Bacilli bacterium]MDD4719001.1 GNAT family N-acetyltransferase [Bacilli bacterium]
MIIKASDNSFYIGESLDKAIAIMTFVKAGEKGLIIDSTYISGELRGKNIGEQLLIKVVEYARRENKIIIPLCPYAKHMMSKTNEHDDVLEKTT